jgi:hypothetical protein
MSVAGLLSTLVVRDDPPKDSKPTDVPKKDEKAPGGLAPFIVFLIIVALFALCGIAIWIAGTHLRARRLGLPAPTFSSYFSTLGSSGNAQGSYPSGNKKPGIVGWVTSKIGGLKNKRTAGGAYEEPLGGFSGGARARAGGANHALDPDEAWDTRVGTEADNYGPGGYYEEQELGLHGYEGAGRGRDHAELPAYGDEDAARGRSRSREPTAYIGGDQRGLDGRYEEEMGGRANPFGDGAERSNLAEGRGKTAGGLSSPTERRSMFMEGNMR